MLTFNRWASTREVTNTAYYCNVVILPAVSKHLIISLFLRRGLELRVEFVNWFSDCSAGCACGGGHDENSVFKEFTATHRGG